MGADIYMSKTQTATPRILQPLVSKLREIANTPERIALQQAQAAAALAEAQSPSSAKASLASQLDTYRNAIGDIRLIDLYRTSSIANACAEFWASNIAAIKFRLYDPNGKPVDKIHVETEPEDVDEDALDNATVVKKAMPPLGVKSLNELLSSPNFHNQMFKVEVTLRFLGQSLVRRVNNNFRVTKDVQWVNPQLYTRDLDSYMGLKGFYIYPGLGQDNPIGYLPIEEALYFNGFSFADDWLGVSSIEIVAQQAATEPEMATTLLALFRNMATPIGILQPAEDSKNYVNKNEVGALTRFFQSTIQGARNFGRTIISASRWQWTPLAVNFKDLDMGSMKRDMRDEIATAFQIEPAFLSSGQSQYNELEGKINIWLDRRFRPRADFYARCLTQQLCSGMPGYEIRADISDLIKEDEALRLQNVQGKLNAMLITVGQGQEQLGQEVDPIMKDIYMIAGIPVPRKEVPNYWKNLLFRGNDPTADGGNGGDGGDTPDGGKKPDNAEGLQPNSRVDSPKERMSKVLAGVAGENYRPKESLPAEARSATPIQDVVSDAVFKELQIAATKAYKGQAFTAHLVQPATWMYIQSLTEWLIPEEATKSERAIITDQILGYAKAHHIRVSKSRDTVQATRIEYEERVNDAFEQRKANKISGQEFITRLRINGNEASRKLFIDGLRTAGVNTDELDEDDEAWLAQHNADQDQWYIRAEENMAAGKYTDAMMKNRGQEWFHMTGYPAYNEGIYSGSKNIALMWLQGKTEQPCRSCSALNGQVRRAKSWKKQQVRPKLIDLGCRGFECDCQLLPTDAPVSKGRYPEWRNLRSADPDHLLQLEVDDALPS